MGFKEDNINKSKKMKIVLNDLKDSKHYEFLEKIFTEIKIKNSILIDVASEIENDICKQCFNLVPFNDYNEDEEICEECMIDNKENEKENKEKIEKEIEDKTEDETKNESEKNT